MPREELTLLDLAALCWARKGIVLGLSALLGIGAFAFTLLSPPIWQAKATLVMPMPETTPVNSQLAMFVGQPASSSIDVLAGIVKSHRLLKEVAAKTDSDPFKLERILRTDVNPAAGQLSLKAEDGSKERAALYLSEAIVTLDKLAKEVGLSVASRTRSEIETSLAQRRQELETAETRLSNFLARALTAPDPANPGASSEYRKAFSEARIQEQRLDRELAAERQKMSQVAKAGDLPTGIPELQPLRDQLIAKETELANAKIQFSDSSREVTTLQRQVKVLRDAVQREVAKRYQAVDQGADLRIAQLEASKLVAEWQADSLRRLADAAPREAAEASRLHREVQTLASVVNELRMQYEKARIDADVDKVRWSVLEPPYIVEPPVNKHPVRSTAFGMVTGFLLGCLIAFVQAGRHHRTVPLS